MKIQCQIWVGRISLLSVKTVLCIIYCGEVHLHVWVTLNNLNSFYKINTPSLRTVSLNVKLHSPQQCLLACLLSAACLLLLATEFNEKYSLILFKGLHRPIY